MALKSCILLETSSKMMSLLEVIMFLVEDAYSTRNICIKDAITTGAYLMSICIMVASIINACIGVANTLVACIIGGFVRKAYTKSTYY